VTTVNVIVSWVTSLEIWLWMLENL